MVVQNLTIQAGATFQRNIALSDNNGNPLNVSGFSANAVMRREPTSNTYTQFAVVLTTGSLSMRMEANTTQTLEPGYYVYDVILWNGTDTYRPAEGIVEVTPSPTNQTPTD